ncbi:MAG: TlpA family protein disulfide reductase [Rhodanobacteraceae bacterium]|nr:TlpA family protein disulfide reductase [Rhodanobacteraceae bacterium]
MSGCGLAAMLALALAPKPPERLPALSAVRADGSALALPDGQATVLNLWASWCPPCRREMPVLADAAARHPQIRFVLLNQGEDADVAAAALREMGIPLDLGAWDPDARASDILEARGYPVTLIIDADGRVLRRHLGEVSRASLAAMLGELTE